MLRSILLLFTLIFFTSCTFDHKFPNTLNVDSKFNENEIIVIESAIKEWEYATNGIVDVNINVKELPYKPSNLDGHGADEHMLFYDEVGSKYYNRILDFKNVDGVIGWASVYDITLFVNEIRTSNDQERYFDTLDRIILHELGHHWGLFHPEEPVEALMVPGAETKCITHYDLVNFCELYCCDPSAMRNTCTNNYEKEWKSLVNYD